jgi:hypothetical protein
MKEVKFFLKSIVHIEPSASEEHIILRVEDIPNKKPGEANGKLGSVQTAGHCYSEECIHSHCYEDHRFEMLEYFSCYSSRILVCTSADFQF